MSFDSLTLYCLMPELRERLLSARVLDIQQPSPHDVCIRFRRAEDPSADPCLLLSAHPQHARAHFVARMPKEKQRSHYAAVLLAHLARASVSAVEQSGLDRVLLVRLSPPTDVAAQQSPDRLLIAEMMGKHSNVLLVDSATGRILECIKHVDTTTNRYRELLPGAAYIPPPPTGRADPFALDERAFRALLGADTTSAPTWRQLVGAVDGISPQTAQDIVARAADAQSPDALWEAFSDYIGRIRRREIEACVLFAGDGRDARPLACCLVPPAEAPAGRLVMFPSVQASVGAYYERVLAVERLRALQNDLRQVLDRREDALRRKLASLRQDRAAAEQAETLRLKGELLMANAHRIPARAENARVDNYYDADGGLLDILLDPGKTAVENAQSYFGQYRKAKRAAGVLAKIIADLEQELRWARDYQTRASGDRSEEALDALRAELVHHGWLDDRAGPRRGRRDAPYLSFATQDGWQILVGRNDRENDWLVTRVARRDDVWLHAKQIPGSHVLVRNPERKTQIPMPVLLHAARLAAYFSKARHSANVPVDYTAAKYVVRPKGTARGYVTYSREKTLYVEPEGPGRRYGSA
jgi:predicted ribosome quality control (RQC) complex YloA/Tae2 family protein